MDKILEDKISELGTMLKDVASSRELSTEVTDSISMLTDIVSSMPTIMDDKVSKLTAVIDELKKTIATVQKMEGKAGKDAVVDYPAIIDSVLELMPTAKDGADGKDGVIAETGELTKEINKIDGKVKWSVLEDFDSIVNQNTLKLALETLENQVRFLIQRNSGNGSGSGDWTPQGITTAGAGGISVGTQLGTSPTSIEQTLIDIFYPPNSPSVSLSSTPTGGLRENGNDVTTIDLTPTTTAGSLPITTLDITGTDGFSYSYPTPNPAGGVEATQTDGTGFSTNTTFTATVGDGTNTGTDTVTFTFVSAYYYGVAAPGLNISADGNGLTKFVVGNSASMAQNFSPTNQVYYFAYPDSYPALTSILDDNGFETISDWTVTTGVSITNSFGDVNTYRKYEFNNITTQVAFTNTFIQ